MALDTHIKMISRESTNKKMSGSTEFAECRVDTGRDCPSTSSGRVSPNLTGLYIRG